MSGPVSCKAGKCVVPDTSCAKGFAHCSANADDGCEADLSKPATCGSCGNACTGATPVCDNGACTNGCANPTPTMCSGACVDTTSNASNCGGCGNACSPPSHATSSCASSKCGFACNSGYHQCGSACSDNTSTASCGSSCTPCSPPANGSATCDGTKCGFNCNAGFHTCNGDGACHDNRSVATCGSSCTPCIAPGNATPTCDGTSCGFTCNGGFHQCGGACDSNGSVNSCGASCTPCPVPTNGTATCDGTSCGFSCNSGYHACGGACDNNNDVNSCGSACSPCPIPANANPTCDGTKCGFTCKAGFADCDGNAANGCEVNLSGDANNCNACGHSCLGGACSAGACQPVVLGPASGLSMVALAADANGAYALGGTGPVRQYDGVGSPRSFAAPNGEAVNGMAVGNGFVYGVGSQVWAQRESAGSAPFVLNPNVSTNQPTPQVAAAGNFLYWIDSNVLYFAQNPPDLNAVITPYGPPTSGYLSGVSGNALGVVWFEGGPNARLMHGAASGTVLTGSPIAGTSTATTFAVANDPAHFSTLVWLTSDGELWTGSTDGSRAATRLASGEPLLSPSTTDGVSAFWVNGTSLRRASLAGGPAQTIASVQKVTLIAQYGAALYFYDSGTTKVMKLAK